MNNKDIAKVYARQDEIITRTKDIQDQYNLPYEIAIELGNLWLEYGELVDDVRAHRKPEKFWKKIFRK